MSSPWKDKGLNMGRYCLNQEFKRSNLLLEYDCPSHFTTSQWRCGPAVYVLYRVVSAVYFVVCLILTGVLGPHKLRWFIFLTNWSFFFLTLCYIQMAATSLQHYYTRRRAVTNSDVYETGHHEGIGWVLKLQWVLYNISSTWSLLVTIIYWPLLWHPSHGFQLLTFVTHGSNSIFILLDIFLNAIPIRLLHLWQPVSYLILYMGFGLIYVASGGTDIHGNHYIYHVLDIYNKPDLAVLVGFVTLCVAVPLVWVCMYGLVRLRVWLVRYHSETRNCQGEEGNIEAERVVVVVKGAMESQCNNSKIESCL